MDVDGPTLCFSGATAPGSSNHGRPTTGATDATSTHGGLELPANEGPSSDRDSAGTARPNRN
eukprot:4463561-Pyramimonas_sp.AAC.1